jgi:hypothetical protein
MVASEELREALVDLTNEKDYRLWLDPYWARVHPYRVTVKPGDLTEATTFFSHEPAHLASTYFWR